MGLKLTLLCRLLTLFATVECHLFMGNPPPFRWGETKNIVELVMPLNGAPQGYSQQPFPCKGHHVQPNGTLAEPSVTWSAGQTVTFQLYGSTNTTGATMNQVEGAAHSGGSCQISFSYDKGRSWVVQNYEGDCPRVRSDRKGQVTNFYDVNQDYTFTVPADFPSGDRVIVAWTWINATGNREYYMSCSCVRIEGVGPSTDITPAGPPLLVANLQADPKAAPATDIIWSKCNTPPGTSMVYSAQYDDTPTKRAPTALNLQEFPALEGTVCDTSSEELMEKLSLGRSFAAIPEVSNATLSAPRHILDRINNSSDVAGTQDSVTATTSTTSTTVSVSIVTTVTLDDASPATTTAEVGFETTGSYDLSDPPPDQTLQRSSLLVASPGDGLVPTTSSSPEPAGGLPAKSDAPSSLGVPSTVAPLPVASSLPSITSELSQSVGMPLSLSEAPSPAGGPQMSTNSFATTTLQSSSLVESGGVSATTVPSPSNEGASATAILGDFTTAPTQTQLSAQAANLSSTWTSTTTLVQTFTVTTLLTSFATSEGSCTST
ncbi:hypothetical protein LTS18_003563 [Coniosporium uncinatum]|uniref:Uncharacterized protein n=1 Tax=Coniosporium uncinatum TaxID=93489 RepID=A0ACC3DXY3_9PEZI|nr:hypothetical protein LTS18_003563 [Coniosporium uncinatum]